MQATDSVHILLMETSTANTQSFSSHLSKFRLIPNTKANLSQHVHPVLVENPTRMKLMYSEPARWDGNIYYKDNIYIVVYLHSHKLGTMGSQ